MCDQNDISLETAAQVVIAGLQSGAISLPFSQGLGKEQKNQLIYERAQNVTNFGFSFNSAAISKQAEKEIRESGVLIDAAYIRGMIFAIAGKELPER